MEEGWDALSKRQGQKKQVIDVIQLCVYAVMRL
jgi:hypothetical protein